MSEFEQFSTLGKREIDRSGSDNEESDNESGHKNINDVSVNEAHEDSDDSQGEEDSSEDEVVVKGGDEVSSEDDDESSCGSQEGDGGVSKTFRKAKPEELEVTPGVIYCCTTSVHDYGDPAIFTLHHTLYDALLAKWEFVAKWANESASCSYVTKKFVFDDLKYSAKLGDTSLFAKVERVEIGVPKEVKTRKSQPFFKTEL